MNGTSWRGLSQSCGIKNNIRNNYSETYRNQFGLAPQVNIKQLQLKSVGQFIEFSFIRALLPNTFPTPGEQYSTVGRKPSPIWETKQYNLDITTWFLRRADQETSFSHDWILAWTRIMSLIGMSLNIIQVPGCAVTLGGDPGPWISTASAWLQHYR